jgi:D-3-phosphoglycerate dehydrogenase / 2-oxoglutarate reductase
MALMGLLTDADRFPFSAENVATLSASGVELRELAGHDPQEIVAAGRDASVIFVYHAKLTAELIAALPALRLIARCGTGIDGIDIEAARARGVVVTHVVGFATDEVADQTIGLLLACARRIVWCDRSLRQGIWPSSTELGPLRRLRGQVLGLVGFGLIARGVSARARALGLLVIAHDPYVDDNVFERHEATRVASVDVLLEQSDFVSLHAPLTDETRGMIGSDALTRMRRGATLVNTGRGELVDEQALVEALRSGQLQAAGLDVYAAEPLATDSPLRTLEQVVLEPHAAAFSEEALGELRARAIADTVSVLGGRAPVGVVA